MTKTPEQNFKARTRRSFLALGLGGLAGTAAWIGLRSQPAEDGAIGPFRHALQFNERITGSTLFSDRHQAPEFPLSAVQPIRSNGTEGLDDELDLNSWKLQLVPARGSVRELTMEDILKLPKVEHTTELKCIEGWSAIVHWGGARLRDFTAQYAAGSEGARYVGMETPDQEYFVGVDMASALHPQTLLCYEMNGKPLEETHGAPLRLVIPVKYGIKNIKRIGKITYTDVQPPDYWAKEGYDYYAGL